MTMVICERFKIGNCAHPDTDCGFNTGTPGAECETGFWCNGYRVKLVPATPEYIRSAPKIASEVLQREFYDKPKKETKVKYTQTKPISLEKLWDAQTAKACVDFLKEWAVFMNWIAQSNRCPTWDTEFDHTFGTFMRDMKNNPHATTWLGYLEKHGFIKKEFEPFEITLPVNFEERLMKSIQAWPLRIDRHSVWGEAICDQLKAHGIEV